MKHTVCKPGARVLLQGYCPAKVLRIYRQRDLDGSLTPMAEVEVTSDIQLGPEGYRPGEILILDADSAVPKDCVGVRGHHISWSFFPIESDDTEIVDVLPPKKYCFHIPRAPYF